MELLEYCWNFYIYYIISYNNLVSHFSSPFYRWEDWGTERLSKSLKITPLVHGSSWPKVCQTLVEPQWSPWHGSEATAWKKGDRGLSLDLPFGSGKSFLLLGPRFSICKTWSPYAMSICVLWVIHREKIPSQHSQTSCLGSGLWSVIEADQWTFIKWKQHGGWVAPWLPEFESHLCCLPAV